MNVGPYRTWLFDCDGVLLDSNQIKTAAFERLVAPFGADVARAFVAYHVANGGVSRRTKLRYLFEQLLQRPCEDHVIDELATRYGALVRDELLGCRETPGLRELLARLPADTRRYVVSGADERELREVLEQRGLAHHFHGVFGGPRTKVEILTELATTDPLGSDAVFLGDSRYDCETAAALGIDFIFISGCTEVSDWRSYVAAHGARAVSYAGELWPR
jgi:phosphoglycolate phosphatase-like HAD superfamily hydrolase